MPSARSSGFGGFVVLGLAYIYLAQARLRCPSRAIRARRGRSLPRNSTTLALLTSGKVQHSVQRLV